MKDNRLNPPYGCVVGGEHVYVRAMHKSEIRNPTDYL